MAKAQVKFKITGDTSGLKRATGEAQGLVGSMSGKIKGLLGPMAAAAGTAFATDKIIGFGTEIVGLSGKMTAWKAKSSAVFEGQADAVRKWADRNNESFGLSVDELEGLVASFGDLVKPMGFSADQAADMSKDVVGLAGALSAWSGGAKSSAEATEIMAKAMLGERDGLVELGIKISDLDVQQKLAAKGQDKLTGSALEQAKALATRDLIFEKSTDAQKAWANGSMDAAKSTNSLKATIADAKAKMAEKFTPAIQTTIKWLAGPGVAAAKRFGVGVSNAVRPVIEWFRANWGQIKTVVVGVLGVIGRIWRVQFEVLKGAVLAVADAWDRWGPKIRAVVGQVKAVVGPLVDKVVAAWGRFNGGLKQTEGVAGGVRKTLGSVFGWIATAVSKIATGMSAFWGRFGPQITAMVTNIVGAVVAVVTRVAQVVGAVVMGVVKVAQNLWTRFGQHIIDFGRTLWENLGQVFGGIVDVISGVFGLIKNVLTGKWGAAWDSIKQIASGAWNVVLGVIQTAWGLIQTILGGGLAVISTIWSYAWGGIKAVASAIWDGIKAVVGAAIDGVKAIISWHVDGIKAVWNAAWGGIKDVVGAVWDWIGDTVQSGVDRVKAVFEGLRDIGSNVWDAFRESARAAFNGVARLWNSTVGELSFSIPSWVPKFGGSTFAMPRIPELASGGVATKPTLAVIGEYPGARSDPEIVSPRSMIVAAVRDAISATGTSASAPGPNQPIIVRIELDGRTLAEAMVPTLRMAL